jgi:hypothetical protein
MDCQTVAMVLYDAGLGVLALTLLDEGSDGARKLRKLYELYQHGADIQAYGHSVLVNGTKIELGNL